MKRSLIRTAGLALMVALILAVGCKFDDELEPSGPSGPPPAAPGTLKVVLSNPNPDDTAILLRVTGPVVNTPQLLATGVMIYHRAVAPGVLDVILVGSPVSGDLFTMDVPDADPTTDFSATVVEVADASEALRPDLSGYSASIAVVQPASR